MKTIEDKLHIAHELGRIAGAAECIEDEGTRDAIYGAAESLFDGLLAEAGEEVKASREKTANLIRLAQNYPPDPLDFVETGEMVEKEPDPKKETNFDRITKCPAAMVSFMNEEIVRCPPGMEGKVCDDECTKCWLNWLNEEVKEE